MNADLGFKELTMFEKFLYYHSYEYKQQKEWRRVRKQKMIEQTSKME